MEECKGEETLVEILDFHFAIEKLQKSDADPTTNVHHNEPASMDFALIPAVYLAHASSDKNAKPLITNLFASKVTSFLGNVFNETHRLPASQSANAKSNRIAEEKLSAMDVIALNVRSFNKAPHTAKH